MDTRLAVALGMKGTEVGLGLRVPLALPVGSQRIQLPFQLHLATLLGQSPGQPVQALPLVARQEQQRGLLVLPQVLGLWPVRAGPNYLTSYSSNVRFLAFVNST